MASIVQPIPDAGDGASHPNGAHGIVLPVTELTSQLLDSQLPSMPRHPPHVQQQPSGPEQLRHSNLIGRYFIYLV